jgi:hypothetical protein
MGGLVIVRLEMARVTTHLGTPTATTQAHVLCLACSLSRRRQWLRGIVFLLVLVLVV